MANWIIPCSIKDYNIIDAFNALERIDWKQSINASVGDTIYIYVSNPIKCIKYKCSVEVVDKDCITIDDSKFYINPDNYVNYKKHMQIKLIKKYNNNYLSYDNLKRNGLIGNIQGPLKVNSQVEEYILSIENKNDLFPRILCCEIAWMEKYAGPEENVSSGGEYVKTNKFGHEEINFLEDDGYYHGFVQSSNGLINLNRIDSECFDDTLDDVLIVWCATRPHSKRTIVGYYNHAKVYKNMQKRVNSKYDGYYFEAKVEDSKLLDVSERNFDFDEEKKGNIGRANIWYADSNESINQIERIKLYIKELIDGESLNRLDSPNSDDKYVEGQLKEHLVTSRERDPKARRKCIEKYGYVCQVCGINLERVYGPVAKDYIHVHHIHFISDIDGEHTVNPEEDLITVCPNCHAMLHLKLNNSYLSIGELKQEMIKAKEKLVVGYKIKHPSFGVGTIKAITNKDVTIYFTSKGSMTINKSYVLEKCEMLY